MLFTESSVAITLNVHVLAHALGARAGLTPDPVHPSFAACTSREDTHAHRLCSLYLLRRQVISGVSKWQERQRETDRDWEGECQERRGRGQMEGKRKDVCKGNVGLSQRWEIPGTRLIMATS